VDDAEAGLVVNDAIVDSGREGEQILTAKVVEMQTRRKSLNSMEVLEILNSTEVLEILNATEIIWI
jgi:hypothetical protein